VLVVTIEAQREALCRALERCAQKPKGKRVHALRVATRRLQSALQLACAMGVKPKPRLKRQLDELLLFLSPVRDVHVAQCSLEALAPRPPGVGRLTEFFSARERRLEHKASRRLATFDVVGFERDIARVSGELVARCAVEQGSDAVSAALRGELMRQHLKVERRRRSANAQRPKSLHRLRLTLKRYRYDLEALAAVLPREGAELSQRIAQLQDHLGDAHDAHWLAERTRELAKTRPKLLGLARTLEQTSSAAQFAGAEAASKAELAWPLGDEGP
jgi:CHAD domain-containing protein